MNKHTYQNYPRIFSLSTVGIKYHGYQDYLFHPTRTDFVGESGYGKSMVGDILQLIFVGAKEFRSGTRVDTGEDRKPEGMVLDQKRQNSIGYVFLNIEVSQDHFIVIGMYIEANVSRTSPFIIQAGYVWDGESALTPFTKPITHRAFLQNEMLIPIEAFEEKMNNQMDNELHVVKVFKTNVKQYHTILNQNNILPIDVGSDNQKLKAYAQILQSFARGKGFKSDSDSLKSFLFGDQDAKTLLEQFERESKQLKTSIEQYHKNKVEVAEIGVMVASLKLLEELSQQYNEARQSLLIVEVMTHYNKVAYNKANIQELSSSLNFVRSKLLLLQEQELIVLLQQQELALDTYQIDSGNLQAFRKSKDVARVHIDKLEIEEEILAPQYHQVKSDITDLELFMGLVESYGGSYQALLECFSAQMRNGKEREQLTHLITYLQGKDLFSIFEMSSWSYNCESARSESKKRFAELDKEIELLASLKLFSNISDPNSLARWALDRDDPLTVEQESALLHFQTLPRSEVVRKEGQRFLPNPDEVFTKLTIDRQYEDGFWLDLAGVYEFVPVRSLLLTSKNKADLRQYLEEKQAEFNNRYDTLIREKEKLEKLERALQEYGYTQAQADIFANRVNIAAYIPDEKLPKSQEDFDACYILYKNSKTLYDKSKTIEDTYNTVKQRLAEERESNSRFTQRIEDLEAKIANKNKSEFEEAVLHTREALHELRQKLPNIGEQQQYLVEFTTFKRLLSLQKEYIDLRIKLEKEDAVLQDQIFKLEQMQPIVEEAFQKAQRKFETELLVAFSPQENFELIDVEEAKETFTVSERTFKIKLGAFIDKYADTERYRLENTTDVRYVAHVSFPRIFPRVQEVNATIAEQTAKYLDVLNEKNRELDASGRETVSRIFRSVRKIYSQYIETCNRLKQFFTSKDTQITGRYNVKLTSHLSTQYPVAWLDELDYNLSLANMPLFSNGESDGSLQDILIETFKRHTDGTKAPELKRLLDPKSYFEIGFTLENVLGTTHGSEGQAYTAIALLCIARLSLIEGNHRGKKRGVRFIPIDEAEGIGSNYHTLYNLALTHGYQVISMSIYSVAGAKEGEQTIYTLIPNPDPTSGVNSDPFYHLGYHHEYAQRFYNRQEV